MAHPADGLRETINVELVHSLFATIVPALIMSLSFVLSAILIYVRLGDLTVLAIGAIGAFASLMRIAVALKCRREAERCTDIARARRLERWFAATYMGFAACLGAFGGYIFTLASAEAHMLTICLLVGYCAGVAAVVGLRPHIAIPSMVIAIGPAIIAAILSFDAIYWAMSATAAALLAGGSHSVIRGHRAARLEISKRLTFASLARHDGLTTLPNRLALREWFDEHVIRDPAKGAIAVHYLDLDGFKPVNDEFGHPVGDALLCVVATRLTRSLRASDIAVRLGGDEFAVVQCRLGHAEEAQMLAHRLSAVMKQPFRIGDHTIRISASIGTVTSSGVIYDLEQLLGQADQALYLAKRGGGMVTRKMRSNKLAA